MDHPTRPLNQPADDPAAGSDTRRLTPAGAEAPAGLCPKCGGRMSRARLAGTQLQFGSRRAIPAPYVMDCAALVCTDCYYTELYAEPREGRGSRF